MSERRVQPLRVHGDRFVRPGMLDFAVNIWPTPHPRALRSALIDAVQDSGYPDESAARLALARRHRRDPAEVLTLNGACEAFWLLAHALPGRRAACVHPSFTEAEAALRQSAGSVTHVMRPSGDWALDPQQVPADAELVVLANPNNPTGNLDPPARIAQLARAGRTLVVDESFIDFVPGEHASLAQRRDLPGLVVLRSLTKLWNLASVRAGYLLGPPALVARLQEHRQPWSVSAPALAAIGACAPDLHTPARVAAEVAAAREDLYRRLAQLDGVRCWPAQANFVLLQVPNGAELVARLAGEGIAVRPCQSFPGLDADHIRLAVRTPTQHAVLAAAIARAREHLDDGERVRDPSRLLPRS